MRRSGSLLSLLAVAILSVCGSPVEPDNPDNGDLALTAEAADSLGRRGPVEEDEGAECRRRGVAPEPTEPCLGSGPQRDGAGAGEEPDSPGHPHPGTAQHEPEGFSAIALTTFADSINAEIGECTERASTAANTEYLFDASSPTGDGAVFRGQFPTGMDDGHASFRFDCWGPTQDAGAATYQYEEVYISFWLQVEGPDYENQANGTKVFYIAYGDVSTFNDGFLQLHNGTGHQAVQTHMMPLMKLSRMNEHGRDTPGLKVWPRINSSVKIRAGQWHQVEVYFKINDVAPTTDNGIFRMWIDGTRTTEVTDWRYRSDENPASFYHVQFTPIWGGNGGDVRTRDDYWRLDGLYISGR